MENQIVLSEKYPFTDVACSFHTPGVQFHPSGPYLLAYLRYSLDHPDSPFSIPTLSGTILEIEPQTVLALPKHHIEQECFYFIGTKMYHETNARRESMKHIITAGNVIQGEQYTVKINTNCNNVDALKWADWEISEVHFRDYNPAETWKTLFVARPPSRLQTLLPFPIFV